MSDLIGSYKNGLYIHLEKENVPSNLMEMMQGYTGGIAGILQIAGQSLGVLFLSLSGHKFYLVAVINAVSFLISGLVWFFYENPKRGVSKNISLNLESKNIESKITRKKLLDKPSFNFMQEFGRIYSSNSFVLLGYTLIINFAGSALETVAFIFLLDHQILTGVNYTTAIFIIGTIQIAGSILGSFIGPHILKNISYFYTIFYAMISSTIFLVTFFIFKLGWLSIFLLFTSQILNTKTSMLSYSILINNIDQKIMGEFFAKLSIYQMVPILAGVSIIPSISAFSMKIAIALMLIVSVIGLLFSIYLLHESSNTKKSL
ncbi:MAG: hypothetical protein LBC17_01225 [Lactobacillaceae bacterium]|jgi:MFS family permease|nr:hypothetical protein [Lactobacillaceae bacterium]